MRTDLYSRTVEDAAAFEDRHAEPVEPDVTAADCQDEPVRVRHNGVPVSGADCLTQPTPFTEAWACGICAECQRSHR